MRLRIDNVSKNYIANGREIPALRDVTIKAAAGEFVALCGKSGCGKSTLLLAAGGLLRPDTGRVLVDDFDLYEMSPNARAEFRAEHIGFVFQQFHLIPYLTVMDNVLASTLGAPPRDKRAVRTQAEDLVDRFGLSDRQTHRPSQLSTGERQRVALARALLNNPTLLLADEPTGNLDEENSGIVLGYLEDFVAAGGAVVLATHDESAASRAQRIRHLADGQMGTGSTLDT